MSNDKKSINPIGAIPGYVKIYEKYLGRKIYLIFIFSFLASVTEGLGFLMLLPLLQSISGNSLDDVISLQDDGFSYLLENSFLYLDLDFTLRIVLLTMCLLFFFKGAFLFTALSINAYFRGVLVRRLKRALYFSYRDVDYEYFKSKSTGHFINTINEQSNRSLLGFYHLNLLVANLFNFVTYIIFIGFVAFSFGVGAAIIGMFLLLIFRNLAIYVRKLSRKTTNENGNLSQQLVQFVQAFKYLVATGQTKIFDKEITSSIENLSNYQVWSGIAGSFTHALREPLAVISIVVVIFVQVGYFNEPLTPILVAILLFYKSLNSALAIQNSIQNTYEYIGGVEFVNSECRQAEGHKEKNGGQIVGRLKREIRFRDVCYRHPDSENLALNKLSLSLPVNNIIALVGGSGAGKTTVANLLCGVGRPEAGFVKYDDYDYLHSDLASIRSKIGYVSQENVTFDGSIIDNITLKTGESCSEDELLQIEKVAKMAGITEFVSELPKGYHTIVGDRGLRLSGGQRQRLFLARELYRNPEILILDEATSALDVESEALIQNSINELRGKITVLIIAHRLSTIRDADMIYVLDRGSVIESGDFKTLRDKDSGKFRSFMDLQEF